jgi:rod shape determining protein RodA
MALIADTSRVTLLQRDRPMRPDLVLVIPYLVLSALGLLMIYSATAPSLEANGLDPTSDLKRQAVFVVVGFIVFGAASMLDVKAIRSFVPGIYLATIFLLVIVLFLGREVQGAQRWIPIGSIQFQPSEFAKLAVILAIASVLSAASQLPLTWDRVAQVLGIFALPSALIFLQPDLGTMLVFGFLAVVMLFAGGATGRQLAFLLVAVIVGSVLLFQVGAIKDYQITRLTAFLDPATDLQGAQYNQAQSEIAIGSGALTGKGVFEGTQTNLRFVPEQESDFIFTAVGEQMGFVGSVLILVLFSLIIWRVLAAAHNSRDRFGQLVAVGAAALVAFHVVVNIGMTIRLMPVTGLPLPFMSAGGTVFVAMSAAIGMAHSVWLRRSPVPGERLIEQ